MKEELAGGNAAFAPTYDSLESSLVKRETSGLTYLDFQANGEGNLTLVIEVRKQNRN